MMIRKIINKLFAFRSKKITDMSISEKLIIREFAENLTSRVLKSKAIYIHRYYAPIIGTGSTPEQRFMSEVDNPAPDLILRNKYRQELLESDPFTS